MKSPSELILASASPYRRTLLRRVLASFDCVAADVDERPQPGESAHALVTRLALAKARAVAALNPNAWVIGSDQAALLLDAHLQQRVLGKPVTAERCIEQLTRCSGRTVAFLTAVAVARGSDGGVFEFIDTTRVTFRTLEAAAIERYVAQEAPLDCAGGFKSEGLGIALCSGIDSDDPSALVGLPLIRLCAVLRGLGFDIP